MAARPTADGVVRMGALARSAFVALPLAALVTVAWLLTRHPLPLVGGVDWIPALGIRFAWRIDGLAALMLLMITGVGSAVFVHAGGYLTGHPGQRRLYVLLSAFMLGDDRLRQRAGVIVSVNREGDPEVIRGLLRRAFIDDYCADRPAMQITATAASHALVSVADDLKAGRAFQVIDAAKASGANACRTN